MMSLDTGSHAGRQCGGEGGAEGLRLKVSKGSLALLLSMGRL